MGEEIFGRSSDEAIISKLILGTATLATSDYASAIKIFEEALPLAVKNFADESSVVGMIHNNLGVSYKNIDLQEKALIHFEQALRIYEYSDPLARNRLVLMNNIAGVLSTQGKMAEGGFKVEARHRG